MKNVYKLCVVAVIGLLALAGCDNVLRMPGEAAVTSEKVGTFTLVAGGIAGRTILPAAHDFSVYTLAFTKGSDTQYFDTRYTSGYTVSLPAGTWNLTVTAYRDSEKTRPAARSIPMEVTITAGYNTSRTVELLPIDTGGTGTFRWKIDFPDEITYAAMSIYRLNPTALERGDMVKFVSFFNGTDKINTEGSEEMDTGYYEVEFSLSGSAGNTGRVEYLHIYQNMESLFIHKFSSGLQGLAASLAWLQTNAQSDTVYDIEVDADESLDPQTLYYSGKTNVTVRLAGGTVMRTISLSNNGSLFTVGWGVRLVLDRNITLRGNSENTGSLVSVEYGTLEMRDGSFITGNTASYAGGVYVYGGTFTMSGGEISGNTAYIGGGGVYMSSDETFTKTGGGTVYGYTAGDTNSNVVKDRSGVVKNNLGHAVYVNSSLRKRRETTAGPGVYLDSEVLGAAGGWENNLGRLAAQLSWLETNAESNSTYTFEVDSNEDLDSCVLYFSGNKTNVTVRLTGGTVMRTISLSGNGSLFTVRSDVHLVLDKNITLRGHSENTGPLVSVGYGTLEMRDGSFITGNTASYYYYAGGVYVYGGTFTMSGGEISGNTAYSGGGVYVNDGTFTMSGGEISGNTAYYSGGGVCVSSDGTFTMSGGEISGNTSSSSSYNSGGGGVYVNGVGTFTKTGNGTIYGYTAGDSNSNVAKDSNGVVQNNMGHAVYVVSSPAKRRETTAGPGANLDSRVVGAAGGWEN
jgi:hypothetical protein